MEVGVCELFPAWHLVLFMVNRRPEQQGAGWQRISWGGSSCWPRVLCYYFFFFHAKDFGSVVVGSFLNLEAEPGTGSSSLCSGETQTSFENSALTLGLRDFSLLFRHNRRPPLNSGEAIVPPFKGFLAFLSRDVAAVTGLQAYRGLMMQPAKFSPKMDSVRTFVPFFTS